MAARVRTFDWSATPLGPIAGWPQSLKTAVDIILASGHAMMLAWGPERTLLYNDAYAPMLGARHPDSLGAQFCAAWPDIWEEIAPLVARVFAGEMIRYEDMPLTMTRHGHPEETWWDFSYSPVRDESGAVAGLLNVTSDAAPKIRSDALLRDNEARQAFLLQLSDAIRPLNDAATIERTAVKLLGEALGATRTFYATIAEDEQSWSVRQDHAPGLPSSKGTYPFSDYQRRRHADWRMGQVSSVSDSEADPAFGDTDRAAYATLGARAAIGVPLVRGDRFAAMLAVNQAEPRRWTDAELTLARETAERTWTALERVRVESALRESEEKYRTVFDSIDEGFLIHEMIRNSSGQVIDYRLLEANPAHQRATGLSRETIGKLGSEFMPEVEPYWLALFHRVSTSGIAERAEMYNAPTCRWYNVQVSPVRGHDRIAIVFDDVTARKHAEARLRESEERQRLTIQLVPALLWSASPDGQEVTRNDGWSAYTGQSKAETQTYGWLEAIHPDDLPATRAAFEHAFATGEPLERQQRIRTAGDDWRWHLVRHVPVRDEHGAITRWFGAAVDIHDSKLAEQALQETERRLQTLVEGVPQLVWRASDPGNWTWASPQWTDYTGQAEAESHGWGWLDQVHPDDRDRVLAVWKGAVERGDFHADYRIHHAEEARYRWFQTRATPVRDAEERIVEWLGTSTDIDDLRQLQERQHVLVGELQHRTFNLMGMVRSMADSTIRSSGSLEEFRPKFRDRIDALARVQRLLSRLQDDDRVTFDELIRSEFEAVGALPDDDARVTLSGPDGVALRSGTVQTFAMAIHELTTNAVKYGALGQPDARLVVKWHVEVGDKGEPWLHVNWHESAVAMPPAGAAPRGTGQGRSLIEGALPYQLHARTTYVMAPDGVRCTIALPASARTKVEMQSAA